MSAARLLLGCDFSSSPSRRKPVVVALGESLFPDSQGNIGHSPASNGRITLLKMERFETLGAFAAWLKEPRPPWVGGFDLPFGLPRELVETLGWPTEWLACVRHYGGLSRAEIRAAFAAFCDARPPGGKFAHRATDGPAGSSPSMKWVNPPVAFSYKADERARQTPERLIARRSILAALESGEVPLLRSAGLRLRLTHAQRDALADDATGDSLDAVLCLMQAAWALWQQAVAPRADAGPGWGLPAFDPLEGWIVGA